MKVFFTIFMIINNNNYDNTYDDEIAMKDSQN